MRPASKKNLAKMVGEAPLRPDELEGSEDCPVDGEDSDEEPVPKARKTKRARPSVAKPKAPRNKYVRGKQGGLEGIMKMPLEIFTELAYHIAPGDLIALIRCSKFFWNMLLRRSAGLIWQCAAENIPGLPSCPTEMCQPQYAALMFSKNCTLCGATATAKPDPYLQVRLCSTCRDTHMPKPNGRGRKIRNSAVQYYYLVAEVQEVGETIKDLQRSKDRSACSSWVEDRKPTRYSDILIQQANLATKNWLIQEDRDERRTQIHSRLKEQEWTTADLSFHSSHAKPWNALVETSKPLTDRVWSNILPKLITLLEENRARRLEYERLERRIQRRERLDDLLVKIRRAEHPFVEAHAAIIPSRGLEKPIALDSDSEPESDLLARYPDLAFYKGMPRQQAVVPNLFPQTTIVLEWECLKELSDMEVDVERIEELFDERQDQVRQGIADWRTGFEGRLVEIHEAGAEGAVPGNAVKPTDSEDTKAEPVVKVKGSTDTTKDLSSNVRFLLRADTIFKKGLLDENDPLYSYRRTQEPAIPHLHYYPGIIPHGGYFHEHAAWPNPHVKEVSVEQFHRYTEVEQLVKAMLADLQKPDVARMELDAMKARFACGRCTERKPKRWDDLAKTRLHSTRHPVAFRNVHDVEWTTNPMPLVRILTVQEASEMEIVSATLPDRVQCQPCKGTGRCWEAIDNMKVHLQDVHDIADPTEGLHYGSRQHMSPISDIVSDEWHREWDAFHDAQAAAATAPSSTADP
ncbi:hypothetical protein BDV93DRAFT_509258 [Ceratobasidium sp. AG-I]|nr:hypothetical protein BDV93DRAFT_509258 [Ceratobasidium sp. AG-I]